MDIEPKSPEACLLGALSWDYKAPYTAKLFPCAKDIDALNHVNNAVYVKWCESVARAHMASLGLDQKKYNHLDRAMAIRHADYDYLQSCFLGNPLIIGTWITDSDGKLTLERKFQIIRLTDQATVLRARWQLVCIQVSSGRPRKMPSEIREIYAE